MTRLSLLNVDRNIQQVPRLANLNDNNNILLIETKTNSSNNRANNLTNSIHSYNHPNNSWQLKLNSTFDNSSNSSLIYLNKSYNQQFELRQRDLTKDSNNLESFVTTSITNMTETLVPNPDGGNNNATNSDHNDLFVMPKMDNFVDVFSVCCSTAVIFGGLIPYIPQYLKIKQSMNSEGFSTYVCLTLLLANILRIMFWFGHHFEPPLLIQSFVMIACMLAMMQICVRVRDKNSTYIISSMAHRPQTTPRRRSLIVLNVYNFWNWDDYASYLKFLALFTVSLGSITYFLIDNEFYIETLGFVAVFTESMLGMPQLMRNYLKKSTRGMSVEMVIMWLPGDLFKTLYFILRHSPVQFIACGSIQVAVDILILIQVLWYKKPNVVYRKLPKST